jgi:hypothetical protein
LTSLENEEFPEMVTWVVAELKEKMNLDFGWHQVARKSFPTDQGSGKNQGFLGQCKGPVH